MNIKNTIRTIPNFPKKGIMFRDITTLLANPDAFQESVDKLAERIRGKKVEAILGIESRGFIFGAALAYKMGLEFIPIRKKGKLPGSTISEDYELEYGTDTIEIHDDILEEGKRVVLVDDLIATGGTAKAAVNLIKKTGAELVDALFVINLPDLKGIEKLGIESYCLVEFEGE